MGSNIGVEVVFEKLVKSRALGMSRPIGRRGFRNDPAGGIVGEVGPVFRSIGPKDDQVMAQRHDRLRTFRGGGAAIDLTAATGCEPRFRG